MKIALIVEHADAHRGGAEKYTLQLAGALAERGHQITILSRDGNGQVVGAELINLPARAVGRAGRYARFLDAVDQHLRGHSYEIIHAMLPVRQCDVYHPHAGLAAETLVSGHLKYRGLKRHASRVGNQVNLKRRVAARVEQKMLLGENGPVVLCLSEYVKRSVRERYPIAEDRMATLFNAVDLEHFDPQRAAGEREKIRKRFGIGTDRIVALMIAQDFQRKGLRQTIEAVALLHDPGLVLLVVGKEEGGAYQQLAERLGVGRTVVFAGEAAEPADYYAAADFFVLPTSHDPCSLVVLEALAMGVPVVSTVFNGACEIMRNRQHGFVLDDPGDVAGIAESMQRLLDKGFRDKCSAACLELRGRLGFANHVSEVEDIYKKIIQHRPQRVGR